MPSPAPAILFDLPANRLSAFAATIRRLSGQSLQFRWLPTPDDEPGRVLVRVESPPSLLVDRVAGFGRVYLQTAAGDWAAFGREPGGPETVPPGPFVPEIESLSLEPAGVVRRTGSLPAPVPTPLRLIRGTDAEPARLWVLRDDALGQLTAYCRVTHQQLLARFNVAVSATAGVPCVVLRAITAKGPPPVFVGPAVAFAPLLKLPNVFLPVGTRLSPVLRRDALRRALAVRPDRVEWLHPLGDGRFRVESLPDAAFRPLAEWIDFRVPAPVPAGRPWVQSHRWEFEPFVEAAPRPESRKVEVRDIAAPPPAEPERPRFRTRAVDWLRGFRRRGGLPTCWPSRRSRTSPSRRRCGRPSTRATGCTTPGRRRSARP